MEAYASLHFFVEDRLARSPLRAPFGSLEVSPGVPHDVVYNFLDHVNSRLMESGVREIVITNPPDLYAPQAMTLAANFFLTRKYSVTRHEIAAIVPVSPKPFTEMIHGRKKRKLNQCRNQGLTFDQMPHSSLPVVYEFIATCRKPKNFNLSITLNDLQQFVDRYSSEYLIFSVFYHERMVAASVTIRIYHNVLYHFISDHARDVGPLRPALVLMEGIYDYCQRENIQLLDLGTSTVDGQANFKLVKFKCELGAQLTHKFTFSKKI